MGRPEDLVGLCGLNALVDAIYPGQLESFAWLSVAADAAEALLVLPVRVAGPSHEQSQSLLGAGGSLVKGASSVASIVESSHQAWLTDQIAVVGFDGAQLATEAAVRDYIQSSGSCVSLVLSELGRPHVDHLAPVSSLQQKLLE